MAAAIALLGLGIVVVHGFLSGDEDTGEERTLLVEGLTEVVRKDGALPPSPPRVAAAEGLMMPMLIDGCRRDGFGCGSGISSSSGSSGALGDGDISSGLGGSGGSRCIRNCGSRSNGSSNGHASLCHSGYNLVNQPFARHWR